MISGNPSDFTVEFRTANGDWRLAMAGRKWRTEAGAQKAMRNWLDAQSEFAWKPEVRVIPLHKSYNTRGSVSLVNG